MNFKPRERRAAYNLKDQILKNKWRVLEQIQNTGMNDSGGNFSCGYLVENVDDGTRAFCKAIDLERALFGSSDPTKELSIVTTAYEYEKEIVFKCANNNMRRVIKGLDFGTLSLSGYDIPVPFIIFELAVSNVRKLYFELEKFDIAWKMRSLHHVAVAMQELHFNQILHLDIKPSNVFDMGNKESKLGDLGRSIDLTSELEPSHVKCDICGDPSYAPPELLYPCRLSDVTHLRRATELYLLGSLAVFYIIGVGITQAVFSKLDPALRLVNGIAPVDYEGILPYWRRAWLSVIDAIDSRCKVFERDYRAKFIQIIKELTDPNYRNRGTRAYRNSGSMKYNINTYVGRLSTLSKRADISIGVELDSKD